jgi:hypothetical protein
LLQGNYRLDGIFADDRLVTQNLEAENLQDNYERGGKISNGKPELLRRRGILVVSTHHLLNINSKPRTIKTTVNRNVKISPQHPTNYHNTQTE